VVTYQDGNEDLDLNFIIFFKGIVREPINVKSSNLFFLEEFPSKKKCEICIYMCISHVKKMDTCHFYSFQDTLSKKKKKKKNLSTKCQFRFISSCLLLELLCCK
jgi:hypothetical protein